MTCRVADQTYLPSRHAAVGDFDRQRRNDHAQEHAGGLTLVEAKAAQTAAASLFDGARRVRDHLAKPSRPCDVVVAYGGDDAQTRSDARLVPWAGLHAEAWAR